MNTIIVFIAGIILGWWIANKVRDGKNPIQEIQNIFENIFKTISSLFKEKGDRPDA